VGYSYCSFVLTAPLSDDAEQFCKAFKGWMPEDALVNYVGISSIRENRGMH
jgi:hypothetical protein